MVLDRAAAEASWPIWPPPPSRCASVERKPYRRSPYAPFRTSTLQQEAGRQLRFSADRTMRAAQRLYESGYITYMRTDSTALSETAVAAARALIAARYGRDYLPAKPRVYAQPGAATPRRPTRPSAPPARPSATPRRWRPRSPPSRPASTSSSGSAPWPRRWPTPWGRASRSASGRWAPPASTPSSAPPARSSPSPGSCGPTSRAPTTPTPNSRTRSGGCPALAEGDPLDAEALEAKGHETKPPARYTEASLVRRLEELGIGRPSTYASIISTIQERGYVWKKGPALVPSFTAFATVQLLERHFADLVDYEFTRTWRTTSTASPPGSRSPVPT